MQSENLKPGDGEHERSRPSDAEKPEGSEPCAASEPDDARVSTEPLTGDTYSRRAESVDSVEYAGPTTTASSSDNGATAGSREPALSSGPTVNSAPRSIFDRPAGTSAEADDDSDPVSIFHPAPSSVSETQRPEPAISTAPGRDAAEKEHAKTPSLSSSAPPVAPGTVSRPADAGRPGTQGASSPPAYQTQQPARPAEKKPLGLLDMQSSEELLSEVDSGDDGRFVLTSQRLIYQGRSGDGSLFSAAAISDVTAVEFGRRPRSASSALWGVVGLLAAVAVWQVTTNETVGALAGGIVAVISLLLLADYWFRPGGLMLRFGTSGGTVEGPVSGKRIRAAEELAAMALQIRQSASSGKQAGTTGPPGGSPGLR